MANKFPPCPSNLKSIAHYLKIAEEHDDRDIIVTYWCRLHALEIAIKIVQVKTPEIHLLLLALMDWLEKTKSENMENEGITNKLCAQANIENYALKLFDWADEQDRAEQFGKNVVKAFYTAGILMDVLTIFGPLSVEFNDKRKYSKWKAAYIHNCLKSGERPLPGAGENEEEFTPVDPPSPKLDFHKPILGTLEGPVFPDPPTDLAVVPPYSNKIVNPEEITKNLPSSINSPLVDIQPTTDPGTPKINPGTIQKAQKHCKWAESALNYDDIPTSIDNLQKALHLLQFGQEKE